MEYPQLASTSKKHEMKKKWLNFYPSLGYTFLSLLTIIMFFHGENGWPANCRSFRVSLEQLPLPKAYFRVRIFSPIPTSFIIIYLYTTLISNHYDCLFLLSYFIIIDWTKIASFFIQPFANLTQLLHLRLAGLANCEWAYASSATHLSAVILTAVTCQVP